MADVNQALSFGAAAADYDRFRPRYPEEALRWALDGPATPARVVDLGAGTPAALTLRCCARRPSAGRSG
ncbi:hypothetical protein [Micromonospora sp. NPDC004551]|uniref:hypothetical protein n=1 Tax=Micromonospora sp. NPDC004551 TaxID=3154284 RepID=UPI0033A261DB